MSHLLLSNRILAAKRQWRQVLFAPYLPLVLSPPSKNGTPAYAASRLPLSERRLPILCALSQCHQAAIAPVWLPLASTSFVGKVHERDGLRRPAPLGSMRTASLSAPSNAPRTFPVLVKVINR